MARAHRLGQTNKVKLHSPTCPWRMLLVALVKVHMVVVMPLYFAGNDFQAHNKRNHWRKNDADDEEKNGFRASSCWEAENTKHQPGKDFRLGLCTINFACSIQIAYPEWEKIFKKNFRLNLGRIRWHHQVWFKGTICWWEWWSWKIPANSLWWCCNR